MDCILCNKPIKGYDPRFHHLKIDDSREVDVCAECIEKFMDWQATILSDLFPTKAMKRRFRTGK